MAKFNSTQAEIAFFKRVIADQIKALDIQDRRLRAGWIERDRLRALLLANNIDIGTPTPDSLPVSVKEPSNEKRERI